MALLGLRMMKKFGNFPRPDRPLAAICIRMRNNKYRNPAKVIDNPVEKMVFLYKYVNGAEVAL